MSKFKNRYIILLAGRTVRLCNFETVPFSFFLFTFFSFLFLHSPPRERPSPWKVGGFEPTERKTRDVGVWLENLAKPPPWYSDSRCPLPWEGEVYSHPEPSCFRVLIIRAETLTFTPFGSVFSSGSHWSSETFSDGHNLEHGYPPHPEDEGQGYHSASSSTQDTLPCPFRDVRGSVLVGSRTQIQIKRAGARVGAGELLGGLSICPELARKPKRSVS